ncbi:MAG: ral secretion pathway protein [Candidatus Saccharibacteria bacterium]|nr:ral secretion pathway protein [Candidatus Saccharibacteria bacterium]
MNKNQTYRPLFTRSKKVLLGFTLVELIIVIAVIGILATITIVGLSRYQSDARDAQRASSITVIAEALEKYYDQNGEYPSCPNIANASISTVTTSTLAGVDKTALIAPKATDQNSNSLKCTVLTTSSDDFYEYTGDGSSTCSSGSSCLSYTLKYKEESTGAIKTMSSRRATSIATSGVPVLNSATPTYTTTALSWGSTSNAASYAIQRSSSCTDFSAAVETSATTSPATITGLTPNVFYCFRVAAVAGSGQRTNFSNSVSATTTDFPTPVPALTGQTSTSVTFSWPAVGGANSYDVEMTVGAASFTGTPTSTGVAAVSFTQNGTIGTVYNFKVRALTTDNGGPLITSWSNTVSGSPILPSPTGVTNAWTNNFGSSSATGTCSQGTIYYQRATTYQTSGSTADAYGAWTAWQTGTTFATDFIAEGMYGKVKTGVKCVQGANESLVVEATPITKVRPITSITAGTWYNQQTAPALIGVGGACVSGSTEMYKWGQVWHGSAGYHSAGGWGQWGDFQVANGTPNYSMNDGLNVYRISRTICRTPYWERSMTSQVPGGTLGACCGGDATYNSFVNSGYNYSVQR